MCIRDRDSGQITGAHLGARGAGIEQGWGRAHEIEGGQELVELDGPLLAVELVYGKTHGDPHEEGLGQLEAHALRAVDEVAVIEGLQPEIGKSEIALGFKGGAQAFQVVLGQAAVQELQVRRPLDVGGEVVTVCLLYTSPSPRD